MKKAADWMHFCDDPKNKYFAVCNITNLKDIPTRKYVAPYETDYFFDTVQIKENIYFTGGGVPAAGSSEEQFFKILIKFTIKDSADAIINKCLDMNIARANHNMIALTDNALYVVGGTNTTGYLTSCEEYLIDKNKWKQIASLNEGKKWVSVCGLSGRYLFAFGGVLDNSENSTDKIESLDTTDISSKKWKIVSIATGASLWKKASLLGTFETPTHEILLFGGVVDDTEVGQCLCFDPNTRTMSTANNLQHPDTFYRTKAGSNDSQIVIVGSHEGDLHIYDKTKKAWQYAKKTIWNPLFARAFKAETF